MAEVVVAKNGLEDVDNTIVMMGEGEGKQMTRVVRTRGCKTN